MTEPALSAVSALVQDVDSAILAETGPGVLARNNIPTTNPPTPGSLDFSQSPEPEDPTWK